MADRTITERLQPSLLDRLTDDAPGERREGAGGRVINIDRLRDIVRRDLSWLLNAGSMDAEIDGDLYPNAANSTVNYGLRDVSGTFTTADRTSAIRSAIREAIARFEPRLRPGTLSVELAKQPDGDAALIAFDIRGEMWAQPLPLELYLRSQVDVTTGHVELDRVD